MKIIAVIVEGELPNMCDNCWLTACGDFGGPSYCSITTSEIDVDSPPILPDCPLRLEWDNARIARGVM